MKTSETVYLSSSNNNINGFTPFTLTIVPSSVPISNKIYKIEYDFGDGTKISQLLKPNSNQENPASVNQTHNYILTGEFIKDFTVIADVYQFNKSSYDRFSFIVSLSAPPMEELNTQYPENSSYYFREVHLIGSRMFGPENEISYMFEGIGPDCFLPVVVNWKQRPVQTIIKTIKDYYRPYKLLSPFENEMVTSINTGTNIVTVPAPNGGSISDNVNPNDIELN